MSTSVGGSSSGSMAVIDSKLEHSHDVQMEHRRGLSDMSDLKTMNAEALYKRDVVGLSEAKNGLKLCSSDVYPDLHILGLYDLYDITNSFVTVDRSFVISARHRLIQCHLSKQHLNC